MAAGPQRRPPPQEAEAAQVRGWPLHTTPPTTCTRPPRQPAHDPPDNARVSPYAAKVRFPNYFVGIRSRKPPHPLPADAGRAGGRKTIAPRRPLDLDRRRRSGLQDERWRARTRSVDLRAENDARRTSGRSGGAAGFSERRARATPPVVSARRAREGPNPWAAKPGGRRLHAPERACTIRWRTASFWRPSWPSRSAFECGDPRHGRRRHC